MPDSDAGADDPHFEAQFDHLYKRAYVVAFRILRCREDAEDVALEALARASVRWRTIRGHGPTWVTRVSANLAVDSLRGRRQTAELREIPVWDPETSERLDLVRATAQAAPATAGGDRSSLLRWAHGAGDRRRLGLQHGSRQAALRKGDRKAQDELRTDSATGGEMIDSDEFRRSPSGASHRRASSTSASPGGGADSATPGRRRGGGIGPRLPDRRCGERLGTLAE